jgi:hypothetical protein
MTMWPDDVEAERQRGLEECSSKDTARWRYVPSRPFPLWLLEWIRPHVSRFIHLNSGANHNDWWLPIQAAAFFDSTGVRHFRICIQGFLVELAVFPMLAASVDFHLTS